MIIAQISDTHLTVGEADSGRRGADFRAVVADINTLDPLPDLIVHTGDIVHNGRSEEYAEAAAILAEARPPVFVLAGNKDDRTNLRAAFSGATGEDFVTYEADGFPLRLLMLDTVNPDSKKGAFCPRRFALLAEMLGQKDDRPVVVFTHHPPFEVMVGPERFHFDDLAVMDKLARNLAGSGKVLAVISGHVHRPTFGSVQGIPAAVAPAAATGVRFGDYPPHMAERPIYFLHRFGAETGISTETQIVNRRF